MALRKARWWGAASAAAAAAAASVFALSASGGAAAPSAAAANFYIVQVAGQPLANYTGGVNGIAATKPAPGLKVNSRSAAATAYRGHLSSGRAEVLRKAGLSSLKLTYSYDVVFNGFAAKMTPAQANTLKHTPGVINVWKNEIYKADTISTPRFLGLDGPNGVWQKLFGGTKNAGRGVIVGDIDSGFWPENPSFAPIVKPSDNALINSKWRGSCDAGADTPANNVTCNNKVIGARFYDLGGIDKFEEFNSPRDRNSHGSHTASTAAGNSGVNAIVNGVSVGTASGMAPAARLAVYKALWNQPDGTASGATIDLEAAVNDAVEDGVDVINYSISGSQAFVNDPIEVAFMFAADAGVFVATSAGNSGPAASTVAHNAPWETTVAASTHDRSSVRTVTLGNGTTFSGPGVGPAVASAPLVYSADVGLAGEDPTEVRLCFSGTLDPAKVAGKIVACDRGGNARVDKSLAVQMAGGVGMILMNVTPGTLNADFHYVPSIHVNETDRATILAYIAGTASPTASLSAATAVTIEAPSMAAFSSNGPATSGGGDLLKPDITAPGVDVIAAVSPTTDGNMFNALSGTSMSTPHISGIAAMIIGKHQDWSPMRVKSALMTTASTLDNAGNPILSADGANPATPLNFGSGHVVPAKAFDPGLVYDSNLTEWVQFGCGLGQFQQVFAPSVCASFGSIDPSNLNTPNLAVGDLPGTQTLTRKVTNVGGKKTTYKVAVSAPPGFTVQVTPTSLTLGPGMTKSYTAKITRTTAPLGTYQFGSLTWTDNNNANHKVRSMIALRPVALSAPAEVTGSGASGSTAIVTQPGYDGTLTAAPHGLVAADVATTNLVGTNTTFDPAAPTTGPAIQKTTVTVPAGSRLARFATKGADYPAGTDLDLFVYTAGTATRVAQSAGGTADESVTLTAAGSYDIYVVQFALAGGVTEQAVQRYAWVVPDAAAGNLTVAPASQASAVGTPATVTATWTGLTAGSHYLGVVSYGDGTNEIGRTILAVDA